MRILAVVLLLAAVAHGQGVIVTVGGSDVAFPDEGQAALQARLERPVGVFVEASGSLLITCETLHMVMRMQVDGTVRVVAGNGLRGFSGDGGPARSASLSLPQTAISDAAGNIFIADLGSGRVRRVNPAGVISTYATGLATPWGLALDGAGNLYVAEANGHRVRRVDRNGVVTTFAGNGQATYGGDGGPAAAASISLPRDLAMDRAGNLYIADNVNRRIRRVSPDGVITTVAGGGQSFGFGIPATTHSLADPQSVAVDNQGNLYIGDRGNHRVLKVDAAGMIGAFAGAGGRGSAFAGDGGLAVQASLGFPAGMATDAGGNLYIADSHNDRIRRVGPNGIISTVAGRGRFFGDGGPATQGRFVSPTYVAVSGNGDIFVSDLLSNAVRRISRDGVLTNYAGSGDYGSFGDGGPATSARFDLVQFIAADAAGNLYLTDTNNRAIRRVSPNGVITTVAASGGVLAAEPDGTLYFGAGLVVMRLSGGVVTTVAGNGQLGSSGDGGPATQASLTGIASLAADGAGNLYIAEFNSHRVRKVDRNGIITTFAGNGQPGSSGDGGPATAAAVSSPIGLAADASGNVFIATGSRIRRVTPGGTITAYAGTGAVGFSGDGGPATGATFIFPVGLATDAAGNLYIADTGGRVRMVLAGPSPALVLSQRGLTFTTPAGGAPPPQSFTIVNGGQGVLNWGLTATTLSGGGWLSVSSAGGTAQAGQAGSTIDVLVNATGLAPGDYYGQIEVRSPNAPNSPQSVTVVLNVLGAGVASGVVVQPSGLVFTSATAQSITLTRSSGAALGFTAAAAFPGGTPWFTVQPAQGQVAPGAPAVVQVRPNLAGLAAGVYDATITFTFADGTSQRVELLLVIPPGGLTASRQSRAADGCTRTRLRMLTTSLGSSFQITMGFPTPLEVRVVDDCAQPMSAGTVTASFSSGDAPVTLASLRDGRWSATWQARNVTDRVTITMRAESAPLSTTMELSGSLRANANPPPEVAAGGVLNAASFRLQSPLAPGSLISIFGQRLSVGETTASALPLPTTMEQTLVVVAGRPLPLLFTSPGQINAMVPYDLAINATHQLLVRRGTALSIPEPVSILSAQSGVFTKNLSGAGPGIIVAAYADGSQAEVGEENPVAAGDTIVIYCTGLGDVEPRVLAGAAAPLDVVSRTIEAVTVTIGGKDARVLFAGLTPGFTGLYQINAIVPEGVEGGEAPLVVSQAGLAGAAVRIAIR